MNLRASLLRTLENQSLSVDSRVELCCEVSRELEDRGEYEEAQKVLRDYWPRAAHAKGAAPTHTERVNTMPAVDQQCAAVPVFY